MTIQMVRYLVMKIKQEYPSATMSGLRDPHGTDIETQFTGGRNDPFVLAVRHCMTWIIRHGCLPIKRYTFNTKHDAKALAACVERWLGQDARYAGLNIHIPAISFVVAARHFGLEESGGNWPFYQISEHAIRRGYYSENYKAHIAQYVRHRLRR